MLSRRERPQAFGHMGYRETFFSNPDASFSALCPQELNPWSSRTEETLHSLTVDKSERQTQDQDQRCQSGQSADNSVIFSGGDSFQEFWERPTTTADFRSSFLQFPAPATFACWKIRFKTEVYTCSQLPTEAVQWIKEVEMIDTVDDLLSSFSTRGIQMPNFEVLDARIPSALTRIIHNSQFKRRISLEEQQGPESGPFLRGRQIAYLDTKHLQVTRWNDSVENFADLFTIGLRSSIVYDENPTWWHLGRIVQVKNTRVWETQDRIGIVWPGDSSEEVGTWLSQIENYGEEKYRAGCSK